MHLRRATIDDALDVLDWRNDPHTRAMSREAAIVDRQAHLDWFARAVEDPSRLLLMGEADGDRIGMVRFDRVGETWEVSINVAPRARGRGLGAPLLDGALKVFAGLHPDATILAVIKPENVASLRLFEGLGFQPEGGDGALLHFSRRQERP